MKIRIAIIALFLLLAGASAYFVFQLKFAFDFEQFFPKGDPDLEVFRKFTEEFETDDNFMLIALRREGGILLRLGLSGARIRQSHSTCAAWASVSGWQSAPTVLAPHVAH